MSMFAINAKLTRRVKTEDDCKVLQEDLDKLWGWTDKWLLEFSLSKCQIMKIGKKDKDLCLTVL